MKIINGLKRMLFEMQNGTYSHRRKNGMLFFGQPVR